MKTRVTTLFSFVLFITLLGILLISRTVPGTAQEPDPLPSPQPAPFFSAQAGDGLRQAADGKWYMSVDGQSQPGPTDPAVSLGSGGPDEFGYTWNDSVGLNWISAAAGANTGLSGDSWDEASGPVSLPFSFKYYENNYTQLYIAAAGYIAFDEAPYWDDQSTIPLPAPPNNVIAPYWTPTYIGSGSWVRYLSGGTSPNRYFVVEWHDVKGGSPSDSIGNDDTYRFEVILYESGDIVFQYQSMDIGGGSWWCGINGIEDARGLDGLNYIDFCNQPPSYKAIRFYRPAPSARVTIDPLHQGRFTKEGEVVAFEVPIRNTGELGADTYDLFVSSSWPVNLFAADGTTPLTDTEPDGTIDTGALPQGDTTTIVVKVSTPGGATVGDSNSANITVRSSLNLAKSKMVNLRTAVPASFAQVYEDAADSALSLYLVKPQAQKDRLVAPNRDNTTPTAVAEQADGFAYFWTAYKWNGSVGVSEIEYALFDHQGETLKNVTKLTKHNNPTAYTYDYQPAVAVAPNGRIGVVWYRYLYNGSNGTYNYNIYYAILDGDGNVIKGPTNVTQNTIWGDWNTNGIPEYYYPRIAATTDNRFVMAWQRREVTSSGTRDDIYFSIRNTNGGVVKPVTQYTFDTPDWSESYYSPNLTQLSANRVLLLWFRNSNEDDYYAVLDSAGNTVKGATNISTGSGGWDPDAVQLSNGNIVVAWQGSLRFAVLNSAYNRIIGPVTLSNPAAVTGDACVSVATDDAGRAILTWMDTDYNYRRNLYYALVSGSGSVLTQPTIFRTKETTESTINTACNGYGNTSFSWNPPSGVDGVASFESPLFSGPPAGDASIRMSYSNYGLSLATGVVLTATLDSDLTYVSDTSGVTPTVNGNDVVWNLPDFEFWEKRDLNLIVQLPPGAILGTYYPVSLALASDGVEANIIDNNDNAEVWAALQRYLPLIVQAP